MSQLVQICDIVSWQEISGVEKFTKGLETLLSLLAATLLPGSARLYFM